MAEDIKLQYDSILNEGDITCDSGDLLREEGIATAVLISLFTDRRADEDDLLDDPTEMRGWWGDQTSADANDKLGSRLWLLERATVSQKNMVKAKGYITEALQWLIDDGIAQKINVTVGRQPLINNTGEALAFSVEILKKDGNLEAFTFDDVWAGQFAGG